MQEEGHLITEFDELAEKIGKEKILKRFLDIVKPERVDFDLLSKSERRKANLFSINRYLILIIKCYIFVI